MSLISSINEPTKAKIRVVCFDLGGVLIRINRTWQDALFDAGIRSNLTGHLVDFHDLNRFQEGHLTEAEFLPSLKSFLGVPSTVEAARVLNLVLKEEYPGVFDLIEDLNEEGIITACLSNTNAPHWKEMEESGRFPAYNALKLKFASQELRLSKPDPAIFRAFEDAVGAMPSEIMFFDDTEENVDAAHERGWKAHWIDHNADPAQQMEVLLIGEGVLAL